MEDCVRRQLGDDQGRVIDEFPATPPPEDLDEETAGGPRGTRPAGEQAGFFGPGQLERVVRGVWANDGRVETAGR